jgi:hypothetical protein
MDQTPGIIAPQPSREREASVWIPEGDWNAITESGPIPWHRNTTLYREDPRLMAHWKGAVVRVAILKGGEDV